MILNLAHSLRQIQFLEWWICCVAPKLKSRLKRKWCNSMAIKDKRTKAKLR